MQIRRWSRGNWAEDQSRAVAAATSGQSDSTMATKFDPLNGLPTSERRHVRHRQGILELLQPIGGIHIDQ